MGRNIIEEHSFWEIKAGNNCNTPVLTPFALNVHEVYIVINHGVELKAKSPTIDLVVLCSVIEIVADGIS